ncbi:MFS transporter [Rhodococcus sp. ABRD24]|uniref:MFS transporter n=1 Tax=Rhodococcus sp. ABRD24 TaxID=2507582 RepID=UPI00103B734A|nr:MFS transporter [Rhodococcus sp. ABRD24]QBJ95580.1 MFS transporter [Rhodococcus sp. ABRD24]
MTTPNPEAGDATSGRRRAVISSFVGTTIEWYDFFLYGSAAALIFGPQFFPSLSPLAGALASFGTFAVGFIARPIGAMVMGYFGDRVGRKSVLVASLMLMGLSTVLIGLLPAYESIGVWAPILLIVLRLLQGIGVGGEWGGAALMSVEHAPKGRRGLFGAFPQMGMPAGMIFANLALLTVSTSMPQEQFASWGWRIPFLASAVLILVGLYIRIGVEESPYFKKTLTAAAVVRNPISEVLKNHWRAVLLGGGTFIASNAIGYLFMVYLLSYGTKTLGLERNTVLIAALIGSATQFVMLPVYGYISDFVGRKRVYLFATGGTLVWSLAFFPLIDTRSTPVIILSVFVLALLVAGTFAAQGAMFSELFPTSVRYSGASLAYQIGAVFGGGFAPMIATALHGSFDTSAPVVIYMVTLCVISLVCIALIRETSARSLDEFDQPSAPGGAEQRRSAVQHIA